MLQGSGGNIGVSVGDDGIVVVDDQYAPLVPKIKDSSPAACAASNETLPRGSRSNHRHPE